jgi:hypothetical protein
MAVDELQVSGEAPLNALLEAKDEPQATTLAMTAREKAAKPPA